MKKRCTAVLLALVCLLLAGCKTMEQINFDVESVSKAQKIVVADASGAEKSTLTEEADIEAFIEAADIEGWRFADLPESLEKAGSFTLWQEVTGGGKSLKICTLIIYDRDYLTIDTGVAGLKPSFSLPQNAALYLRGLAS